MDRILIFVVFASHFEIDAKICKPSEVLDEHTNECLMKCSNDTYVFDKNCVTQCPKNSLKLDTGIASFCYFKNDLTCDKNMCNKDFPLCYRMHCLKSCPEFTVEFENKCLMECPEHAPFMTALECNGICTTGRKLCSKLCTRTHPYLFTSELIKQCLSECPDFTELSDNKQYCNLKCPPEKPFLLNSSCFSECPDDTPFISNIKSDYNIIYSCVKDCPKNIVLDEERCVESCPSGKMLYNNACVVDCPDSRKNMYAKDLRKRSDIRSFGIADFMCVEDCNSEETRDNFGNYIYVSYKNVCRLECPHSAYYELNGYCIEKCPDAFSFIEPQHNRKTCKIHCEHFVFNQTCHHYCPSQKMFIDNKTCVWECPSNKPYVSRTYYHGDSVTYLVHVCTTVCPQFYSRAKKGYCTSDCEDPYVIFNNSCIEECPSYSPYKEKNSNGYMCVDKCRAYMYLYGTICVSSCPNEAQYTLNMTCVSECSDPLPYKYHSIKTYTHYWPYRYEEVHKYNCVASCPLPNQYNFNQSCVSECPLDQNKIYNNTCLHRCPGTAKYMIKYLWNMYICEQECSHLISLNNECVSKCPTNSRFNYSGLCVSKCGPDLPYHFLEFPERCLSSCPDGYYINEGNKACQKDCPKDHFTYGDQCVNICPDSYPINYTKNGVPNVIYTCVSECPFKSYELLGTCYDKCPNNTSGHDSQCVQTCPDKYPYRNDVTGACVDICPIHQYLYQNASCILSCGQDAPFIEMGRCVEKCSTENKLLVQKSEGHFCYNQCPESYIELNESKICQKRCPTNTLIINNVCQYLPSCPPNTFIQETTFGKKCTAVCPTNFFVNENARTCSKECKSSLLKAGKYCVSRCPQDLPFEYEGICYDICPVYYVGFKTECIHESDCKEKKFFVYNHVCREKCPSLTIKNSKDHDCYNRVLFIALTVLFAILSLITIILLLGLIYFTGFNHTSSSKKPSYENKAFTFNELQEKERQNSDDSSVA